jgi:hypothetical protein
MANRLQQLEAEAETPVMERMRFGGPAGKENFLNAYHSGRRSSLGLPSRTAPPVKELRRQYSHETRATVHQQQPAPNAWANATQPLVHHILPLNSQSKVLLPNHPSHQQLMTTTGANTGPPQRLMPDIPVRKLEKSQSLCRPDPSYRNNSPAVGTGGATTTTGGRKLPHRQRSTESNWTSGVSDVSTTYGTLSDSTAQPDPTPPPTVGGGKQLPRITAQQQAILRERTAAGGVLSNHSSHTGVPSNTQLRDLSVPLNSQNNFKNQMYSSNGFPKTGRHIDPGGGGGGAPPIAAYADVGHSQPRAGLQCHSSGGSRRRSTTDSVIRNDSLSSDQSECVRPPPPRPYKARNKSGKKLRPYSSFSSSDDEIRSTPEPSTEDDLDLESESVSEKGEHLGVDHNLHKCQKSRMRPEEILDAKIKKFLAVSLGILSTVNPSPHPLTPLLVPPII